MELVVVPRREPLAPSAVLGVGEAARSLFRRLRELPTSGSSACACPERAGAPRVR